MNAAAAIKDTPTNVRRLAAIAFADVAGYSPPTERAPTFSDLGERELKNISRPVRLYRLEMQNSASPATQRSQPYLAWMRKPSIAVLPFRNLSNDPGEAYFGEGITEDIIGGLSRNRSFFVIARHSTLPYRDRSADPGQIAAELGVRYIVDGSVRR